MPPGSRSHLKCLRDGNLFKSCDANDASDGSLYSKPVFIVLICQIQQIMRAIGKSYDTESPSQASLASRECYSFSLFLEDLRLILSMIPGPGSGAVSISA